MKITKAFSLMIALSIIASCSYVRPQLKEERLNPPDMKDQLIVGLPDEAGLDVNILAKMLDSVEDDEHKDLNSILVTRKGVLVLEAYFNGEGRNTLHDIRSAGKSFTSTLVGIALQKGYLKNLDQKILTFFPEYMPLDTPDDRKERVTIRHLLEMRSGFDANDSELDTPGCEDNMYDSKDWIHFALNVPMSEEPGKVWKYAGMNTMLLGGIVQSATRIPLPKFLEISLLKPMGISKYHWNKDPTGRAIGQGNLFLRPRDMVKFGLLFLHNGKWNDQQVVSAEWVHEATLPYSRLPSDPNIGYGYQWWISSEKIGMKKFNFFYANGNGGQRIYVVPDADMVVVITSFAYNQKRGHERSDRIFRNILSSIMD